MNPRRRIPRLRSFLLTLLAIATAVLIGAGVENVAARQLAQSRPTVSTVASSTAVATLTADQAAAARLNLQTHEGDYCNCNR